MKGPERETTGTPKLNCKTFENLVLFYACDELEAAHRAGIEEHAANCAACAAVLARELRLRQVMGALRPSADAIDPADVMLSHCRSELAEALDDAAGQSGRSKWLELLRPANWFLPSMLRHPSWSAALLVLMGIAVGTTGQQWYLGRIEKAAQPTIRVSPAPRLTDQDLQTMGIAGLNWNWSPGSGSSGSPNVELHLTAEKPVLLQGNLDDADVKRVLTFVVQNGQRFDSGVRLDTVEVLRARSSDTDVRGALCAAARRDQNPGVRLKALEALRDLAQDEAVRETLIDALENDDCPGVRVEAVTALRAWAEKVAGAEDPRLVTVLRDRMERDPNNYVRLQSAAAMRQLEPRRTY
jgi:hypothetical protein